MTTLEPDYRKIEHKKHRHQISNTFKFTLEEVFQTLETEDVKITAAHYLTMIEPIINRNFCNNIHHHNGPNQRKHVHKLTGNHKQYR